ncbi:hypothetical protein M1O57_05840, partial [Dehalococcoidia bacterium]|nr:hypothetical protein [Dehalococcoidia bacterium]
GFGPRADRWGPWEGVAISGHATCAGKAEVLADDRCSAQVLVAMIAFLATAALAYLLYLALTTASGDWFLWSKEELIIGAVFALIVGEPGGCSLGRAFAC